MSPGNRSRPRTLSDESLLSAARVAHSVDDSAVHDNGGFVTLHATSSSSHSLTSLGSFQSLGSHSPRGVSHGTESTDGGSGSGPQYDSQLKPEGGAEQQQSSSANGDTLDALNSLPSLFGHSRSFSADQPSRSGNLAGFNNSAHDSNHDNNHVADTDSDRSFAELRPKMHLHVDTGAEGTMRSASPPSYPAHPLHKRVSRVKHGAARSPTHRRTRSGSSVPTTKREADAHDAWKRLKDLQVSQQRHRVFVGRTNPPTFFLSCNNPFVDHPLCRV